MENLIIIGIILLIVGLAIWYIIRAKKRGQKCIGCPYSGSDKQNGCTCCNNNKY